MVAPKQKSSAKRKVRGQKNGSHLFLIHSAKEPQMGKPALKEREIPSVVPKKIRYESLRTIDPITPAQEELFAEYNKDKHLFLSGLAGTGKSFCAIYLAMREILLRETKYQKVVVVRSTVPVRESGFLPGTVEEKELVYQLPYHAIFKELFNGTEIVSKLVNQELYEFISTSYIRGITLNNCIVIVDEIQDLTFHEADSIITRIGSDCKIIFCGDRTQSDLRGSEQDGMDKFMTIIDNMNCFSHIDFKEEDIVRSALVKSYIINKRRLGL